MAPLGDMFTLKNQLFATYAFYAAILAIKTLLMAFATARHRMAKGIFANPEDAKLRPKATVKLNDPDVERVRRAHQNDLENILVFLIICPLYLLTGPSVVMATNLIRAFTGARILHTVVYLNEVPQPSRGICFMIGQAVNVFMCFQIVMATK